MSIFQAERIKKFLGNLTGKFSQEKFSFGLDIGNSTLKLVKLRLLKEDVELSSFHLEPSQPDLVSSLKKLIQSQGAEKVNLSVSGPASIIRYANFPKMNQDELEQALKFEAQKHIPFSLSDVTIDGYILKQNLPENKMLVLLAAVKKDFMQQRLKLIEEAGLKANIIDVDSIALINAFNFNYSESTSLKGKTFALLNIGCSLSNLNILEDGLPHLSRDIQIAGNKITQRIADIIGVDLKLAEQLKINPDKEKLEKVRSAIEPVLTNLASEIRTSFDFYESQSASSVAKIFLSGGSSLTVGLKEILANLLGLETECWDPLKQIKIAEGIDVQKMKAISAHLAVAIGLALRQ